MDELNNPKFHATTDQEKIREITRDHFKNIYKQRNDIKSNRMDIEDFLKKENDTKPWEEFNKHKISSTLAESMEGDLTLQELEEALFYHMNGFTVNHLWVFWQDLKFIVKDALNAVQEEGLSQMLRCAILKLLRKGEKDTSCIENYRPISRRLTLTRII